MQEFDTFGDERLIVAAANTDALLLGVTHPDFARVATVQHDGGQADALVSALLELSRNVRPAAPAG